MKSAVNLGGLHPAWSRVGAAALLALVAVPASAASVTLCAEPYTVDLPGSPAVPMWGYRVVTDAASCSAVSAPRPSAAAPVISMPAGDSTLSVTLVNRLTVPTSLVIAGQALPSDGGDPVMAVDLVGASCDPATAATLADRLACRVRSFTGETDAGASRTYTFTNLRPGSFLLQSGTHPQAQVQMGLHAMLRLDAPPLDLTARRLYVAAASDANAGFDADAAVVLSEVDPVQHARIAATLGTEGSQTQWRAGGNSTFAYAPRYFLINGRPFDSANVAASDIGISVPAGGRMVLRIANAGLQSRTLMLNNGTWRLLTEDGHPYAAPREQATVLLPAGKTTDALMQNATTDPIGSTRTAGVVFDRRGGADSGNGGAIGGQVARLAVTQQDPATLNRAPVVTVNATPSGSVLAGTSVAISGSATDDGRPVSPGAVTSAWSLSGPAGGAALPPAPSTTGVPFNVLFSQPGRYVVQLLASDGELSSAGEAVVTVRSPTADVSVTKTDNQTSATTGAVVTYTVVVANAGPDAANGVGVTDPAASLAGVTWTCGAATGGATCGAAAGVGPLASSANLPAGASVTYTVSGTLPYAATGTLTNTASAVVVAPTVDPNTANNSATDVDTVVVAAPTVAALDAFNRANAVNLGGSWSQTSLFGVAAIGIAANQATTGLAVGNALWNVPAFPALGFGARQGAAATLTNVPVGQGLILKATGGTAAAPQIYLRVRVAVGQVVVERTANAGGTFATLATWATTVGVGDRLTAVANADGSVDVWQTAAAGGTTYLGHSATSASTGGGRVGIRMPAGVARLDNFGAQTLP